MLAGLERMLIVGRTTAGKEELRKRGWHPNGDHILPRGVGVERIKEGKRTVGQKWFYEEPDAGRIRRAFQLLLAGQSYNAIAETIGGNWTDKGIRGAMLEHHLVRRANIPLTADRKEPMERRVIAEAEALITRETWEVARNIILGRKKAHGSQETDATFSAGRFAAGAPSARSRTTCEARPRGTAPERMSVTIAVPRFPATAVNAAHALFSAWPSIKW